MKVVTINLDVHDPLKFAEVKEGAAIEGCSLEYDVARDGNKLTFSMPDLENPPRLLKQYAFAEQGRSGRPYLPGYCD